MLKRIIMSTTLTLAIGIASFATASTDQNALSDYFNGQLTVQKSFTAKGTNLTGYVVTAGKSLNPIIVYTHTNPDYMIVQGEILDKQGNKIFGEKLIAAKSYVNNNLAAIKAKKIQTVIDQFSSYTEGTTQNTPRLYAFVDPRCGYCKRFKTEIQPIINNSKISVSYIPVSILGPQSLVASTDKLITKLGISKQQAEEKVTANTKLFKQLGLRGTPALFYLTKNNEPVVISGYVPATEINKLLPEMASHTQTETAS